MSRIDPTLGNLDDLFNDQDLQQAVLSVQSLASAHVELTGEALLQARDSNLSEQIAIAEANHLKALETTRQSLEALQAIVDARRSLVEGQQDYLQGRPERGAAVFERAGELFRQGARRVSEVGYTMADWPEATWEKLGKRVDNAITQAVEGLGAGIQTRKERVQEWFQGVVGRIERFADRVQAIPGQIQERVRERGQSIKAAALSVIVPALNWGVQTEERLRVKAEQVATVGEAVIKTVGDVGQEIGRGTRKMLGEVLRAAEKGKGQLTQAYDQRLKEAMERRDPTRRSP